MKSNKQKSPLVLSERAVGEFLDAAYRSAQILQTNHLVFHGRYLGHWHVHDDIYQLSFILAGASPIRIGNKRFTAREGMAVHILPDQWHESDGQADYDFLHVKYSLDRKFTFQLPPLPIVSRVEFLNAFFGLINEFHLKRTYEKQAMRIALLRVLLVYFRDLHEHTLSRPRTAAGVERLALRKEKIDQALDYIHRHYNQTIRLRDIAQAVGLSTSSLAHFFKQVAGMAPIDYLINYRISQSILLFEQPALKISAIAELVGFSDPFFFSRVFKQRRGYSPAQYRRLALPAK